MEITFHGAAREVTGSMHLVKKKNEGILLDCGLFQGRRRESEKKNRTLPFDPKGVTTLVLSHAHIDHSGRIPVLMKEGFNGRIVCTRAAVDACAYLLRDSAHIQEQDARYLNYKTVRRHLQELETRKGQRKGRRKRDIRDIKKLLKKGRHEIDVERIRELTDKYGLERVEPLYSAEDAEQALTHFDGYPYRTPVTIGKNITLTLYDAGHILGSAFCLIRIQEKGRDITLLYTGDMGRFDKPILEDPTLRFDDEDREVDLLVMESTYGNRIHEPVGDLKARLREVLRETFARGGSVIIPSFAFGRTQEIRYFLHELYRDKEVEPVPVYVDSPLVVNLTRVFAEHPEVFDQDAHEDFLEQGKNPFVFPQLRFVSALEDSMAILQETRSHIVISASGMCEAGRILHHLRYKIHNPKNTVLIVGFMAQHTLGRRILESGIAYERSGRKGAPPELRFLKKSYPLKARVKELGGFSAHADRIELSRLLKESNLRIKKIALVHGEDEQIRSLATHWRGEGYDVAIPGNGESIRLDG